MFTTSGNGSDDGERDEPVSGSRRDLEREYEAIIAYVVYSRVMKGATEVPPARDADQCSPDESTHPRIISRQLDYLGGYPPVVAAAGIDAR